MPKKLKKYHKKADDHIVLKNSYMVNMDLNTYTETCKKYKLVMVFNGASYFPCLNQNTEINDIDGNNNSNMDLYDNLTGERNAPECHNFGVAIAVSNNPDADPDNHELRHPNLDIDKTSEKNTDKNLNTYYLQNVHPNFNMNNFKTNNFAENKEINNNQFVPNEVVTELRQELKENKEEMEKLKKDSKFYKKIS